MSIPKLTIPESAFDPSFYVPSQRKSRLLSYIVNLCKGSASVLLLVYALSFLALKPLLQLTAERRYDLLEKYRQRLRDLYLLLISKVDTIPIIRINRNGKVVTDSMCQTGKHQEKPDKFSQQPLVDKFKELSGRLSNITSYSISEMPHYSSVREDVKQFQNAVDTNIFDYDSLYSVGDSKKNLVVETKNDIRSIKGLYMTG